MKTQSVLKIEGRIVKGSWLEQATFSHSLLAGELLVRSPVLYSPKKLDWE
jgi:hypothetical protein